MLRAYQAVDGQWYVSDTGQGDITVAGPFLDKAKALHIAYADDLYLAAVQSLMTTRDSTAASPITREGLHARRRLVEVLTLMGWERPSMRGLATNLVKDLEEHERILP